MSDETTPSANDGAEPSMEDILASIRRIIADDEQGGPVVTDGLDDSVLEAPSVDMPALTLVEAVDNTEMTADDVVNDLVDIDLTAEDTVPVLNLRADDIAPLNEGFAGENLVDQGEVGDLDILFEEIDTAQPQEPEPLGQENLDIAAFDDMDIELDMLLNSDVPDSDAQAALEALEPTALESVVSDAALLDDIDLLAIDNLFEDDEFTTHDEIVPDERVIDPAADLIEADLASLEDVHDTDALIDNMFDDDFEADITAPAPTAMLDRVSDAPASNAPVSATADSDLDLVKSLMADLTDDSFLDDESVVINDADKAVPNMADQDVADDTALDLLDEMPSDEADVVEDILALTLDEEAALQDEALEALFEESALMDSAPLAPDANLNESPVASTQKSLADIAAEAQDAAAQAESAQTEEVVAGDGNTGAGAMLAAVLAASAAGTAASALVSEQDSAPDGEVSVDDVSISHDDMEDLIISGDQALQISDSEIIEPVMSADDLHGMIRDADIPIDAVVADAIQRAALDIDAEIDNTELELTQISPQTPSDGDLQETAAMARVRSSAAKTDTILDDVTETATASAFAQLNTAVEEKAVIAERGDRIGDLVQEALRPMLKEWLDANLKGIVERAVTKEVKRIASGK